MKYFTIFIAFLPFVFCQIQRYPTVSVYFYKSGGLRACIKPWNFPDIKQFEFNANKNKHLFLKQAGEINGTVIGHIDGKWCFVTKTPYFETNNGQFIKYWSKITTSTNAMMSNLQMLHANANNFIVDNGQDDIFFKFIKGTPEYEKSIELAKKYSDIKVDPELKDDKIVSAYENAMGEIKKIVDQISSQHKKY